MRPTTAVEYLDFIPATSAFVEEFFSLISSGLCQLTILNPQLKAYYDDDIP